MIDRFDLQLLNLVQKDDSRTADQLADVVALSPSAIARRLRRLRSEGWIARTIALLAGRLTARRLRALVFIELAEHADHQGKAALGPKFDIREYHAQVLDTGALPLPILEKKIDSWIASKQAGAAVQTGRKPGERG